MLQAISDSHDTHHEHATAMSAATLAEARHDGKVHLLLAATGSVATIKLVNIVDALAEAHGPQHLSIRVVLTSSARHFLAGQSREQPTVSALQHMPCVDAVYEDAAEWGPERWKRGAPILHIELRRWADLLAIVPLSANTLGKITNGLCDNLITSVVRAWDTDGSIDGKRKRILVAPAMWRNPITAKQLRVLQEDWGVQGSEADADAGSEAGWFEVLAPMSKKLACGDVGDGAMKDWREIVQVIQARLGLPVSDLAT